METPVCSIFKRIQSSRRGSAEINSTRNHEVAGSIPGLTQWVKESGVAVNCGVGCRRGSDPWLLWLWCRPAAEALIWPLAWEPPYATNADLKRKKYKIKWKNKKFVCSWWDQIVLHKNYSSFRVLCFICSVSFVVAIGYGCLGKFNSCAFGECLRWHRSVSTLPLKKRKMRSIFIFEYQHNKSSAP